MEKLNFATQVSAWVAETKERGDAVLRQSTQEVIELMQTPVSDGGNMPVKTGFLRASLRAALGEPEVPITFNPNPNGSFAYDQTEISLVLNGAKLGDIVSAVYGANYAEYVNYGTSKMPPRLFVDLAAQQWPQIVAKVCAEAEAGA